MFPGHVDIDPPSKWHNDAQSIHIRTEAALYPKRQAPLAAF